MFFLLQNSSPELHNFSDLFSSPVLPLFEEKRSIAIEVGRFKVSFGWSLDPNFRQEQQVFLLGTDVVTHT